MAASAWPFIALGWATQSSFSSMAVTIPIKEYPPFLNHSNSIHPGEDTDASFH
jgi:hypothetical protein